MLKFVNIVIRMSSLRKSLYVLSVLCTGIIVLQFIFVNHLYKSELKKEVFEEEVFHKDEHFKTYSYPKTTVDFTVNDILDNMVHLRHGDFVNNSFTKNIPSFVRNNTKQTFRTEPLKVIVVPHSHNDPGYKKTFLEYFNESSSKILSLAVEKLFQYHDMTFIWPEICFIEKWWNIQNKTTRSKFKYLVKSGRLELTSGTWVIPDEATPHYFAYLDQMIEGHEWVKRHLGVTPEASFDMDQFSFSSSVRYLMQEAGIKYAVAKRLPMAMKDYFMKHKLMNFNWKLSSTKKSRGIFVQVEPYEWLSFPDSCGPSRAICADLDLGHDIELPAPGSPEMNKPIQLLFHRYTSLPAFAEKVVKQLKLKSSGYMHNVLLMPHGDDFRYDTANDWDKQYKNMKILMQYINSNENFHVRMDFGTLKEYFAEVQKRSNLYQIQYPSLSGDFVPFSIGVNYWSGFFTTRQFLKRLGRELQESLRAADILAALAVLSGSVPEISLKWFSLILHKLVDARRQLDLFQHHDAITGTSYDYVVKDYEKGLSSALSKSRDIMAFLIEYIIHGNCNASDCGDAKHISHFDKEIIPKFSLPVNNQNEETDAYFIMFNPFTQERTEIVSLPVFSPNIEITDQKGEHCSFDYLQQGQQSKVFFETRLPPLSISSFSISKAQQSLHGKEMSVQTVAEKSTGHFLCENSEVNVTFSSSDGSPQMICYKKDHFCKKLKINWRHYLHSGGAYTLAFSSENENVFKNIVKIRHISGSKECVVEISHKVIEIHYILKNTVGVNGRYLQVNILTNLSPANSGKFVGEIAMRVVTSIQNGDVFYTDSNGLQLLKRKFRKSMPFPSNVYPMTSMAVIKDGFHVLNVHSVQPHGVVAREPGTIDIMIDRVAIKEEMGLSKKVTDNKPTSTKLFLHFERSVPLKADDLSEQFKPSHESMIINDLAQHPITSFISSKTVPPDKTVVHFVQNKLPCDMVIANMKCLTSDDFELGGVSLTLFRRSLSSTGHMATQCGVKPKYNVISPEKLFKKKISKKWTIKEMSLSHLTFKKNLSPLENIPFEEMDIKTFLFG